MANEYARTLSVKDICHFDSAYHRMRFIGKVIEMDSDHDHARLLVLDDDYAITVISDTPNLPQALSPKDLIMVVGSFEGAPEGGYDPLENGTASSAPRSSSLHELCHLDNGQSYYYSTGICVRALIIVIANSLDPVLWKRAFVDSVE